MNLISQELTKYFFGDHFEVDAVHKALSGLKSLPELGKELIIANKKKEPHFGICFVCYVDTDTGFFMCAIKKTPNFPSMISFYASSKHRLFGGQTLACVPLQYCISSFHPHGDYIVYRHTFKRPIYNQKDTENQLETGTEQEKVNAFVFTKSREAYETIPGKSYVGLTRRRWRERYLEHIEKSIRKNGATLFNQAIRDMVGKYVIHVHDISGFGLTKEEAIKYEKDLIKQSTLKPIGLNMKVG